MLERLGEARARRRDTGAGRQPDLDLLQHSKRTGTRKHLIQRPPLALKRLDFIRPRSARVGRRCTNAVAIEDDRLKLVRPSGRVLDRIRHVSFCLHVGDLAQQAEDLRKRPVRVLAEADHEAQDAQLGERADVDGSH